MEFIVEKEKFFLSSKGIFISFYNISNLEERLDKYVICVLFNGVLIEVFVNFGVLVCNG